MRSVGIGTPISDRVRVQGGGASRTGFTGSPVGDRFHLPPPIVEELPELVLGGTGASPPS